MTAINVIRQRNAVHVLTDAAVYDSDGVVDHFKPKTYPLPHLNAVLATRGPTHALNVIGRVVAGAYTKFDELCAGISTLLPKLCEEYPDDMSSASGTRVDLIIAGWSESENRPKSFQITTAKNDWKADDITLVIQDAEAFTLTELAEITVVPPIAESDFIDANEYGPSVAGVDGMIPEVHGLLMLELQREKCIPLFEGAKPAHWVGGFALLSTVTASGITQKVIHRWPDEAGEKIDPELVDWVSWWSARGASATTNMTRAERRAAQSKQAKLRKVA